MEPAFYRGDLLLLTNYRDEPIRAGDITVFRIEGRDIPIVHRVLKVHEKCVHFILLIKYYLNLLILGITVMLNF
jgi:signal peptidase